MRSIRIATILFLALFTFVNDGGAQQETMTLTLEKAIEIAMQNNRDILIALEEENRADQQIREAKSGAFPSLTYIANYSRTLKKPVIFFNVDGEIVKFSPGFNNSVLQNFALTQTLYAGGRTWTAIRIASIYSSAVEEARKQTATDIKLQVRQAFLGLLLSQEVLGINRRTLENAEAHLRDIRAMHENGMASEFDLLRAEVAVSNLRPKLLQSENQIVLQKDQLKNILGLPLDRPIEIEGALRANFIDDEAIADASTAAYMNRHDYKNLSLIRDSYEKAVRIEKGGWFPNLQAQYNYTYQGQSDDWGLENAYRTQDVQLNLSFNLFDGFKTSSKVQQARINVKETDYRLLQLKEGIEIQVTNARHAMEDARLRIEATGETVDQAQRAYDIALVRFESGQGTQLEIFDSQVALELAQLNRLQAIFDYETAKAAWENAIGR